MRTWGKIIEYKDQVREHEMGTYTAASPIYPLLIGYGCSISRRHLTKPFAIRLFSGGFSFHPERAGVAIKGS